MPVISVVALVAVLVGAGYLAMEFPIAGAVAGLAVLLFGRRLPDVLCKRSAPKS